MSLSRAHYKLTRNMFGHSDKRSAVLTGRLDLKGEKLPLHHHLPTSMNLFSQNLHLKLFVTQNRLQQLLLAFS